MLWAVYAGLSAVFAALTSILVKIGLKDVNTYLATGIRTMVVLLMSWGMVFIVGAQRGIGSLQRNNWIFLLLSGVATGLSWFFNYAALQIGDVSKVAPIDKMSVVLTIILAIIIFKEPYSIKTIAGLVLLTVGTLLLI